MGSNWLRAAVPCRWEGRALSTLAFGAALSLQNNSSDWRRAHVQEEGLPSASPEEMADKEITTPWRSMPTSSKHHCTVQAKADGEKKKVRGSEQNLSWSRDVAERCMALYVASEVACA